MGNEVNTGLRLRVAERAKHRCEYCLLHEDDVGFDFHLDHIISRKHGGLTTLGNLAYACSRCNLHKGTDVVALDETDERPVRLFHPRRDFWRDHFALRDASILGLSRIGTATARVLRLNQADRVLERAILQQQGRYPTGAD